MLQALLSAVIFLGEIPAGLLTDRIGCKHSMILSQILLLAARILLLLAYLSHSLWLFSSAALARVGIGACFLLIGALFLVCALLPADRKNPDADVKPI